MGVNGQGNANLAGNTIWCRSVTGSIKVFVLLICLCALIFFTKLLVKAYLKQQSDVDQFVKYLESANDYEALFEFGFYNQWGKRETRRVWSIKPSVLERYEENAVYKEYVRNGNAAAKKIIPLVIIIGLLLSACMNMCIL